MSDGTSTEGTLGFLGSIKALLATFVAMAHNRVELLSTELEEQLARLVAVLIWSITALLCAVVGLTFVAVLILLSVDDHARPLVAGVLAAVFLAIAVGPALLARKLLRSKSRPFNASLTELERDYDGLRSKR